MWHFIFYCSNVSLHVHAKKQTRVFMRGPQGTMWTFINPQHTSFAVSIHIKVSNFKKYLWHAPCVRYYLLRSKRLQVFKLSCLPLHCYWFILTCPHFLQSNNEITLNHASASHKIPPALTLTSDTASDVQRMALYHFKVSTFASYTELELKESRISLVLKKNESPTGKTIKWKHSSCFMLEALAKIE